MTSSGLDSFGRLAALALVLTFGAALFSQCSAATTNRPIVMHPAFGSAGKQAGLRIWRIENFEPVPYPPKDYGKFYSGDSYIVLNTKEDTSSKGKFTWDIHYWLGNQTSQDESGAAAILSVELDDYLGGGPVQHREVQEHETQLFLSYFKSGVRYLPGGVASGFKHAETNAAGEKKLYQVKGKRNIRIRQVNLGLASMNKGDCFILDAGTEIYVFVGAKAKRTERLKAISAANQIRDQDHAGRSKVLIVDDSATAEEVKKFFQVLGGGSLNELPDENYGGDDQEFENKQDATVTLYKISDSTGKVVSEKISEKPLTQKMLNSDDSFILDTVTSGIFVWVGKRSTTQEKVDALKKAQVFLSSNNYPAWTSITRVIEGGEPSVFKNYFSDWRDAALLGGLNKGGNSPSPSPTTRTRTGRDVRHIEPRLYWLSIENKLNISNVPAYSQEDLIDDDVMILDTDQIVYIWIGTDASAREEQVVQNHTKDVLDYIHAMTDNVSFIKQGDEPEDFKSYFNSWDPNLWRTRRENEDKFLSGSNDIFLHSEKTHV
nr:PREDICTED: gelsolin-like isoform X1 [Bemisia tabaci]XP_018912445.1 PREDICTED: gelsolin-like isoform X1 [Bemisia tabaci]